MGQQQLILLVLATVIVGLAIVVGINAFSENNLKANSDAMVQDAVRIASDLQAWKIEPQAFGGQPNAQKATMTDWNDAAAALVGFDDIGYPVDATCGGYANANGCFTLVGTATGIQVQSTTTNSLGGFGALTVPSTVTLDVVGIDDEDITTSAVVIGDY